MTPAKQAWELPSEVQPARRWLGLEQAAMVLVAHRWVAREQAAMVLAARR
jgi:hypothetical protein